MATDPVMLAWMVKRGSNGRKTWTRIGAVYPHERGSGLTVALEALPFNFDGRIYLFELNDKDDERAMMERAETAAQEKLIKPGKRPSARRH